MGADEQLFDNAAPVMHLALMLQHRFGDGLDVHIAHVIVGGGGEVDHVIGQIEIAMIDPVAPQRVGVAEAVHVEMAAPVAALRRHRGECQPRVRPELADGAADAAGAGFPVIGDFGGLEIHILATAGAVRPQHGAAVPGQAGGVVIGVEIDRVAGEVAGRPEPEELRHGPRYALRRGLRVGLADRADAPAAVAGAGDVRADGVALPRHVDPA